MRLPFALLALLASVLLSVAIYAATGGRFVLLFLPLLLAAPLLFRRGR